MTMGTRTKPTNRIRPGASRIVSSEFLRSFGLRHHGARSGPAAAEFSVAAGPSPASIAVLRLISGCLGRVGDGARVARGRAGEVVRDRRVKVLAGLSGQRRVEVELLIRRGLEVGRRGLRRGQRDGTGL